MSLSERQSTSVAQRGGLENKVINEPHIETHFNDYIPEKPLALTFTSGLFVILAYAAYHIPETQVDAILFSMVSIAAGASAVGCWYKKI